MTSCKKASRIKSLSLSDDYPTTKITKSIKTSPPVLTTIISCPPPTGNNCNNNNINTNNINSIITNNSNNNQQHQQQQQQSSSITTANKKSDDSVKILKYIDDNIIGKGVAFLGPFGRRKVVYADYDSSGRSLQFLEDYINREVLPAFGDTACTSAVTGLQSKLYCNEAKDIIRIAVNASEDDSLFFTQGSCASLSEKICSIICNANNSMSDSTICGNPVIFVSSSETISNITPWINAGAEVVKIVKTREGFLDLVDLEKNLAEFTNSRRLLIGYFSGASRLTGVLADDVATTILLHQYDAISVWDFSSAGSYSALDMNPHLPGAAKDVMCFNTNKFIGGIQGPGVIVIKKSLFYSSSNNTLETFDNIGMVEYVRAGLVMQLKESIGVQNIVARQEKLCKMILSHIRTIPEIILIGSLQMTAKRIPTICFLVKHPRGSFLHNKFVVAVLNDVFGVQATAGNHIGEILGISNKLSVDYERILSDETSNCELIRPGYTKLLFPYFMPESEIAYILESLKMVATEAWKLLPQYEVDDTTGEWRHHSNSLAKERKWLGTIRYNDGRMQFTDRRISGPGTFPQNYAESLQTARNLFNRSRKMAQKSLTPFLELKLKRDSAEKLRWFMLPGEAHELLLGHSQNVKNSVPFNPNKNNISELPSLLTMFRHNSLSALDVKRFKSHSLPTSPIQIPMRRQKSSPLRYSESNNISPPIVRFSLGGEVTTLATLSNPRTTSLSNANEEFIMGRTSICSESEDIQAYVADFTKGLATEIKSEIREVISKVEDVLENTDTMDINSINMSSINVLNTNEELRSDSVSATDVAEYLEECSKKMANDVKTEIREAVNDIILSDSFYSMQQKKSPSDSDIEDVHGKYRFSKQRYSDSRAYKTTTQLENESDKIRTESFPRPQSTPGWHHPSSTAQNLESSTPNCPYTGAISKLADPLNTSSQDSGINMCFHENDESRIRTLSDSLNESRKKTISRLSQSHSTQTSINELVGDDTTDGSSNDSSPIIIKNKCDCNKLDKLRLNSSPNSPNSATIVSIVPQLSPVIKTDGSTSNSGGGELREPHLWQHLPREVWKQTAEAIDEFKMLKDGDKILVCLSGSSASLSLLHALRQFSRARGIHIEMSAITVGKCGVDPRALMLYLRDINIDLFIETLAPSENYLSKICSIARRKHFNVLAMGNSLDKLADDFLMSVLYKGKLYAPQAHCTNRDGDLRIIRPLIYVREKLLEDFTVQKNLPTRPSRTFCKPLDASNSILKVQEIVYPGVYDNIKSAIRPLLSTRLEVNKSSYEFLKLSLISRD